jgi:uncharacterized protein YcbK (DUF882 family)
MTEMKTTGFTRRGVLAAFAATAITAAPTYSKAAGFIRNGGSVRRLRMYSDRTGERLDMVYWINGDYIADAVREISIFMRDWRNGQAVAIDTRAIDVFAASHRLLEVNEPYMLLSGYRSPETNAMLRATSSGVARNSQPVQQRQLRIGLGQAGAVARHGRDDGLDLDSVQMRDEFGVGRIAEAASSPHAAPVPSASGSKSMPSTR